MEHRLGHAPLGAAEAAKIAVADAGSGGQVDIACTPWKTAWLAT